MSAPIVFKYLSSMKDHKASDLYLTVGFPPSLRGDNGLISLSEDVLSPDDLTEILNSTLTSRQKREFETNL